MEDVDRLVNTVLGTGRWQRPTNWMSAEDLALNEAQKSALAEAVEDQFCLRLYPRELSDAMTLGDFVELVERHREVSGVFECPMPRL